MTIIAPNDATATAINDDDRNERGQTATATRIDMRIPFAGIPVGLSCFFVIYLLDLVDGICALRTGSALSVREIRENWVYRQLKREPARK